MSRCYEKYFATYFSINIYNEFISRPDLFYLYVTNTLGIEESTFGQPNPRITGLARILVIIFYFTFYYTVLKKNKTSSWDLMCHALLK